MILGVEWLKLNGENEEEKKKKRSKRLKMPKREVVGPRDSPRDRINNLVPDADQRDTTNTTQHNAIEMEMETTQHYFTAPGHFLNMSDT